MEVMIYIFIALRKKHCFLSPAFVRCGIFSCVAPLYIRNFFELLAVGATTCLNFANRTKRAT